MGCADGLGLADLGLVGDHSRRAVDQQFADPLALVLPSTAFGTAASSGEQEEDDDD